MGTVNVISAVLVLTSCLVEGRVTSTMTAAQKSEIVDWHNELRKQEGASDMETMKWNDAIAEKAQELSNRCVFDHDMTTWKDNPFGSVGQNLFMSTGAENVTQAVISWYDEKSDYYYNTGGCNMGKMCGHYTQVVWAKSTDVGCGGTRCQTLMIPGSRSVNNAYFFTCNYGPAGNFNGEKPFKKGPACSQCGSGQFYCFDGLCRSDCTGVNCECAAKCQNCGTKTSKCRCECAAGYTGVDCSEKCKDTSHYCGGNPGYPKSWCGDPTKSWVDRECPAFCGYCEPPPKSGAVTC